MKKGFTLIEMLFALLIVGLLATITVNSLISAKERKQLEGITDSVVASLDQARANSQSGKGGENYGVKFSPDFYTFFVGSDYVENDPQNKIFKLGDKFEITENISNSDNTIIFSKVSGEIGFDATINISKKDDASMSNLINVGKLGEVSVIK